MKMKRILICLLIAALTCGATACTATNTTNESKDPIPPISTESTTENPDYITEQVTPPLADKSYDSLEELSNAIGYSIQYPTSLTASSTTYGVKNNSLEIMLFNGKVMTGRLIKARIGNPPETDFYGYTNTKVETRENISYTVHYTNEDECHLITWSENNFLYLMYTSDIHTIDSIIEVAHQIQ